MFLLLHRCPKCGYTTLLGRFYRPWSAASPGASLRRIFKTRTQRYHIRSSLHHTPPMLSVQTSTNTACYAKRSLRSSSCLLNDSTSTDKRMPSIRRLNSLDIQMLSKPLHKQIFVDRRPRCSRSGVLKSKQHLSEQGLWGKPGTFLPDMDVQLPELQGDNIDHHFRAIADELNKPYLDLALELSKASLPPMPKEWCFQSGWTRYDDNGCSKSVSHPDDKALVFDVEVCVKESPRPILAVAVSTNSWYSWVSERLSSGEDFYGNIQHHTTLDELIPMERRLWSKSEKVNRNSCKERLIVGHSVSYDRARIREQYLIEVILLMVEESHTHTHTQNIYYIYIICVYVLNWGA